MNSADVAVIGAGIAGISAALWCRRYGISCMVFEASHSPGGQIQLITGDIPDLAGFSGRAEELIRLLEKQIDKFHLNILYGHKIKSLDIQNKTLTANDLKFNYRALIVASGLRRRSLDLKTDFSEIYYSVGNHLDLLRGKSVCIYGGGDGAFEAALTLSSICSNLTLIYRSDFPAASKGFVSSVHEKKIRILSGTKITEIKKEKNRYFLLTDGRNPGKIAADALVVKIGFEANIDFLPSPANLNEFPASHTDIFQKSQYDSIWICGDVSNPYLPSLSNASAQAGIAVKNILEYL